MIITGINFSTGFNMRGSLRSANAPTSITAYIVSNTVANVSFTAPNFTGDTSVTEYTAIAFPGGVRGSLSTSGSGVITVTGLTDNTNYTFSVTANNTDGPSANSVSSNSIKTNSYPSAPTISYAELVSISAVSSANIVYTAPTSNGNSVIQYYTAVSNVGGITATVSTANSGNITVTGILSNVAYGFTVYAINQYGRGLSSNISNDIYTSGLPSIPTITYAKAEGPTSANIVYIAPTSSGNSVIQYYTATSTPSNIKATVNTANSGNITINGLSRNTSYTFTLTAKNSAGNSLPSVSSSAITTYTVPDAPIITAWQRFPANISYAAPSFVGGSPITSYTLTSVPENRTVTVYSTANTGNISMIGLDDTREYIFSIYATNAVGSSQPSVPTPILIGAREEAFIIAGTYSWIAPVGVTSVSVVAVGAGGGGSSVYETVGLAAGAGGGLGYKNNIAVTPGQSYTVVVGAGGVNNNSGNGGDSYFISLATVKGGGGSALGVAGTYTGDGGGNGGSSLPAGSYRGGGGAAGYAGNGGNGGHGDSAFGVVPAGAGAGGGGGGGAGGNQVEVGGSSGGGVGLYGQGSNGAATPGGGFYYTEGGKGGSGGEDGGFGYYRSVSGTGGKYGGGGGPGGWYAAGGIGGGGAVRIIWGSGRSFPSTNTTFM